MRLVDVSYISPSQASTLTLCERRWWHKYVDGMEEDPTEALAMGGGLAEAHEFGIERGIEEYHVRRPVPDPVFTDPDADLRDMVAAEEIIRAAHAGYLLRYGAGDRRANLVREVPYLVRIEGAARFLQVRVDGVADTYLVEDKLRSGTSMREEALTNERMQGRQLTAEIYVAWRATGELRPVKLRCMKKPDPRTLRAAWKDAGAADIAALVSDHFAKDSSWVELPAERTLEQLDAFEEEVRDLCDRLDKLDFDDRPRGIRNTDACRAYGRACPALELCHGRGA
mgnify:CR=1 FL=1